MATNVCCCVGAGRLVPCCFPEPPGPNNPCPRPTCTMVRRGPDEDPYSICRELGGYPPLNDPPVPECNSQIFGAALCEPPGAYCPPSLRFSMSGFHIVTWTCRSRRDVIALPCSDTLVPQVCTSTVLGDPPTGRIPRLRSCCFGAAGGITGHIIDLSGGWCSRFNRFDPPDRMCQAGDPSHLGWPRTTFQFGGGLCVSAFDINISWAVQMHCNQYCEGPLCGVFPDPCLFQPPCYGYEEAYNYTSENRSFAGSGPFATRAIPLGDFLAGRPTVWTPSIQPPICTPQEFCGEFGATWAVCVTWDNNARIEVSI